MTIGERGDEVYSDRRKSELNDHALLVKIRLRQADRSKSKLIKSSHDAFGIEGTRFDKNIKVTCAARAP